MMVYNNNYPFKKEHLNRFAIIEEPCTIVVKNGARINYDMPYLNDGYVRWIISLRAISKENLVLLKKAADSHLKLTYRDMGHLLMTGALWEEQIDSAIDLPNKGENLIATFDYVKDILRCTNITLIPRKIPLLYNYYEDALNEINELEKIIKDEK